MFKVVNRQIPFLFSESVVYAVNKMAEILHFKYNVAEAVNFKHNFGCVIYPKIGT
jgi:hypothetical protein